MKVILEKEVLEENINKLNAFLSDKGMSQISGGKVVTVADQPEWGNSNYSESTYVEPRKPRDL